MLLESIINFMDFSVVLSKNLKAWGDVVVN